MVKVLIVDDSPVARELLLYVLASDPEILVIGAAKDGVEALEFLGTRKPDVITMDVHMPRMNGLEATRRIMESLAIPIVIVSTSWDIHDVDNGFLAIEAGALAVLEKPAGIGQQDFEKMRLEIVRTVKAMSEVKVVTRRPRLRRKQDILQYPSEDVRLSAKETIKIVAIGGSTGAPPVIQTILKGIPKNFPAPIAIVQHIAAGFIGGMQKWLEDSTGFRVRIAEHGEHLRSGCAYLAPDDYQMGIDADPKVVLTKCLPENGVRPSVSYFFRSVSQSMQKNAIGILLTGMGKDGAAELRLMKDNGAVTIAQDKSTSIVFGMPGEAVKIGGVSHVLKSDEIPHVLTEIASLNRSRD